MFEKARRFVVMLCLMAAIPTASSAQEINPIQAFIDSVALANTEIAPDGTKRMKRVTRATVTVLDLSLARYASYKNLTYTLDVTTSIKVINGTIGAADGFKGDRSGNAVAPLVRVKNGATLYIDATATVDASTLTTKVCPAAVALYDCSTLSHGGTITAPDNGTGVAIYLDSDCCTLTDDGGETNGTIVTNRVMTDDVAVYCGDITVKPGTQALLPIFMKNNVDLQALDIVIELPKGISVSYSESEYEGKPFDFIATDRIPDSFVKTSGYYPNGFYNQFGAFTDYPENSIRLIFLTYDLDDVIAANNGIIAYVPLLVDGSVAIGELQCNLFYVEYVPEPTDGTDHYAAPTTSTITVVGDGSLLLGDVNADGFVTISDPVSIFGWLMEQPQHVFVEEAADYNRDNVITISDGVSIIAYLMDGKSQASRRAASSMETSDDIMLNVADNGFGLALANEREFTAFTMDITLPEGEALRSVKLDSRRSNGHAIGWQRLHNGTYRVICYSPVMQPFAGTDGALVCFETDGAFSGNVTVDNITFVDTNCNEKSMESLNHSADGLSEPQTSSAPSATLYDLGGRRIASPRHGIYVQKGRKLVVKEVK